MNPLFDGFVQDNSTSSALSVELTGPALSNQGVFIRFGIPQGQ